MSPAALYRRPLSLALACAAGMVLSSCNMFGGKPAQGPAYPPNHPVKQAKTKTAPPVTHSGPAPRNGDSSGLSSTIPGSTPLSVSSVPVTGKYIAMTFDDGPSPGNTPRLLNILRERNIKATFFMIGENVDAHPGIVKQIVAEGHEVGNHSYSHPQLNKLGEQAFESQISRTHDAIVRASGVTPVLMRPPYGAITPGEKELLASKYHYHCILWSVDPLDWRDRNSATVRSRILAQTKPGGIILSHDIRSTTVDAMPGTLDELLRRGYHFVTVSQLLAMRNGG